MEIVEISKDSISEIEHLWCELNELHFNKSDDFKEHYASFSFSDRIEKLLKTERLTVYAAKIGGELIGYSIASVTNGLGEVDSLYVKPQYQGSSTGKQLIQTALSWLSEQGCTQVNISVAVGNEEVISFYEKLGFRKRSYMLQVKTLR